MPRLALSLLAATILLAGCASSPTATPDVSATNATAFGAWADPGDAWVQSGARVGDSGLAGFLPRDGLCTANFLFADAAREHLYVGTAAHCYGDAPLGRVVRFGEPGRTLNLTLAYSSWLAMGLSSQAHQEACDNDNAVVLSTDERCWNDFALFEVAVADWQHVHPGLPGTTAPTQVGNAGPGTQVTVHGHSPMRAAAGEATRSRSGAVLDATEQRLVIHTAIPSTRGDSGGPVVTAEGEAVGVMVYLLTLPPTSNGVASLVFLLEEAAAAGFPVELVPAP